MQCQLHETVTWVERLPPGGSDGAEGILDTIQGDALQFLQLLSIPIDIQKGLKIPSLLFFKNFNSSEHRNHKTTHILMEL